MVEMYKLMGRLGAQMSYWAYIRCMCVENGWDFEHLPNAHFDEHKDLIRGMYGTDIPPMKQGVVSICVRRGDYLTPGWPFVNLWDQGYYPPAMALFPYKRFLVFSDDLEWCKRNEFFRDCEFWENRSPVEDLNNMAACEHNITANSSFAWWAAWLNPNPQKKVVAPSRWVVNHPYEPPQDWIVIRV